MQHTQQNTTPQGITLERVEKENQDLKQLLRIVLLKTQDCHPRREVLQLAQDRLAHLEKIRASW